ncbi:PREDICTED: uncharacterized protein LOC106815385 [Priapulus caudatus]|uniref:Uncharacterized protein LOC106815385 n=1 Tax=Priapulus caudatus TaxID=37621 RepID=A0ABM1ET04_PRICU|nr:PREDICTED: uncharacterized protein LOC106815385 [Priapulus caudatus]
MNKPRHVRQKEGCLRQNASTGATGIPTTVTYASVLLVWQAIAVKPLHHQKARQKAEFWTLAAGTVCSLLLENYRLIQTSKKHIGSCGPIPDEYVYCQPKKKVVAACIDEEDGPAYCCDDWRIRKVIFKKAMCMLTMFHKCSFRSALRKLYRSPK